MPLVLVREPNQPVRLFEVRSPKVRIGRATDAELQLPNVAVSRQQALLETQPDGTARLTPLSRKNPVLVDGAKLTEPVVLAHGGQCTIGRYRLTWLHEDHLDTYRLHQLAEMPRHCITSGAVEEETFALPTGLRQRYAALDALRDGGALVGADGTRHRLGAGPVEVGPGAAIPCAARLGRWTAARISWAGAGHLLERTGLFARVEVNGEAVADPRVLEPGQAVCINGTAFTYEAGPAGR